MFCKTGTVCFVSYWWRNWIKACEPCRVIRIRGGSEVDRRCCCTLVYCRQSSQLVKAEQAEKQEAEMKLSMEAPQLGGQLFVSQQNCFSIQRFQHKTPQTSCGVKYANLLRINTFGNLRVGRGEKVSLCPRPTWSTAMIKAVCRLRPLPFKHPMVGNVRKQSKRAQLLSIGFLLCACADASCYQGGAEVLFELNSCQANLI